MDSEDFGRTFFPKLRCVEDDLGFLVFVEVFLQSQSQTQGFLRVGAISNNPTNHENRGVGDFSLSKVVLTSAT